MPQLSEYTRRKCFISYHHEDEDDVQKFIQTFDHDKNVLISRGIGAGMTGDIINSNSSEYIMRRVREDHLRDSTVTIVMVGRNTWGRKFVDWEIAASLRNTASYNRNGLMVISLPSVTGLVACPLPDRISDNLTGDNGYARWWTYPTTTSALATCIDLAYQYRTTRGHLVDNTRALRSQNAPAR
jgi:hypothetical protein